MVVFPGSYVSWFKEFSSFQPECTALYGNFEGFPGNNSAVFGLVSYFMNFHDPCVFNWNARVTCFFLVQDLFPSPCFPRVFLPSEPIGRSLKPSKKVFGKACRIRWAVIHWPCSLCRGWQTPGIPTTIKTMGVNITTIVYLRVSIIQIGSTIILMVMEA